MPPLPADFTHTRVCKPFCEKSLTLPVISVFLHSLVSCSHYTARPRKSYKTSSFQGLCRCRFFLWKTGALWSEYSAKMGCCVESQTRALGLPGFIALGCSILNPCMSQVNCSQVSCLTSCAFRGHWYRPLSSLLYSRTNPSGSHSNAFSRSQRLPQNRNKLLAYGSSLKCCWMKGTRLFSPFRISVYPQTM